MLFTQIDSITNQLNCLYMRLIWNKVNRAFKSSLNMSPITNSASSNILIEKGKRASAYAAIDENINQVRNQYYGLFVYC